MSNVHFGDWSMPPDASAPDVSGDDAFGSRCAACGAPLSEDDERAETINRSTGARGVCHVECYLADQCCYELA